MSHRWGGWGSLWRALSCPLAEFQKIWPICLLPYQTFGFNKWCVSTIFQECTPLNVALVAVLLLVARCGRAFSLLVSCCEELVLISSWSCRPTMNWCDENACDLRVTGTWHLPHQTKINTGRGHFPSFIEPTFIDITCVSCCVHKVSHPETSMSWERIPSMCF